jgi:hypothetical protein
MVAEKLLSNKVVTLLLPGRFVCLTINLHARIGGGNRRSNARRSMDQDNLNAEQS